MEMTSTLEALDRLQLALSDLIASLQNTDSEKTEPKKAVPVEKTEPKKAAPVEKTEPKNSAPAQETSKTTLEEVRTVLVAKSREGKTAQVKMLLERFNAGSLPEVDPADYAELMECGKAL